MNTDNSSSSTLPPPRVSIGLPVYNGENYLQEAIDSILAQTDENLELIISDNASTDATEAICRKAVQRDRRVRYDRNETNLGAAENYNQVFHRSRGKYFKWAAHDDLMDPDFVKRCVQVLEEASNDVVLCHPDSTVIDEHGQVIERLEDNPSLRFEEKVDLQMDEPHERMRHLLKNIGMCHPVFGLIRTETLRRTRLIDAFHSSDMVLLLELALLGKFQKISDPLFQRRLHPGISTWKKTPEEVTQWYDPAKRSKLVMRSTTILVEFARSIWRTPLGVAEKLRCYEILLRTVIGLRKRLAQEWWSAIRWLFRWPR